jgi:hypothetical protein
MKEAIEFHLEGLNEKGETVLEHSSAVSYFDIQCWTIRVANQHR